MLLFRIYCCQYRESIMICCCLCLPRAQCMSTTVPSKGHCLPPQTSPSPARYAPAFGQGLMSCCPMASGDDRLCFPTFLLRTPTVTWAGPSWQRMQMETASRTWWSAHLSHQVEGSREGLWLPSIHTPDRVTKVEAGVGRGRCHSLTSLAYGPVSFF